MDALDEIVKLETVAALKYEGGGAALFSAFDEVFHRCHEHAIIENPMELHTRRWPRLRGEVVRHQRLRGARRPGRGGVRRATEGDARQGDGGLLELQPGRAAKGAFHATSAGPI